MYDQCVNRGTWQHFHGGCVPGLKPQEAIPTNQTSDFSPNYLAAYFHHVCPLPVQVLGMSSVSHTGKLK